MDVMRHAASLLSAGKPAESRALLLQGLEAEPGSAHLWMLLGASLWMSGQRNTAVQAMERAVALDPAHIEARTNLAKFYEKLGRADAATRLVSEGIGAAQRRLQTHPDDGEAHLRLGLFYERQGRTGDALDHLRAAARCGSTNPLVAPALARVGPPPYLAPTHVDPRTGETLKRLRPTQGRTFIYIVEVAGVCNLKCPSCPTGALSNEGRANELMPLSMFQRIAEKILLETPVGAESTIWLFNWGEPLLNPDLPAMISYARERGLTTRISTNLNHSRGLEEVVAAGPADIKISISGFTEENYSRTHRRGKLERVKENMQRLSALVRASPYPTRVWVGQHIYRSNQADIAPLKETCERLGFNHNPMPAGILALESSIDLFHGRGTPDETAIDEILLTKTRDRLEMGISSGDRSCDCELRYNMMSINPDGTVALCCGVWAPENMLGLHFLDHPHEELQQRKYEHDFCETCYAHGLAFIPPTETDPSRLRPAPAPPPKLVQLRLKRPRQDG